MIARNFFFQSTSGMVKNESFSILVRLPDDTLIAFLFFVFCFFTLTLALRKIIEWAECGDH